MVAACALFQHSPTRVANEHGDFKDLWGLRTAQRLCGAYSFTELIHKRNGKYSTPAYKDDLSLHALKAKELGGAVRAKRKHEKISFKTILTCHSRLRREGA